MEYSRQLAQQSAADSNPSESSSAASAIKLDLSPVSDNANPDSSSSSMSDPLSAPEISMPNLTADWDSIWNSGRFGQTQSPPEPNSSYSLSNNQPPRQTQSQYSASSNANPPRVGGEGMKPRSANPDANANSGGRTSASEVDDDQYNWTRTRSTLRAAKGAVESYERSLTHPNDFNSDNDSRFIRPIDEVIRQNAEEDESAASSDRTGKSVHFTANDFVGANPSDKKPSEQSTRSLSRSSGTMRPSNPNSSQEPSSVNAAVNHNTLPSDTSGSLAPKPARSEVALPSQKIIASVKHLYKSFTRGGITVPVLQDLSFDIARGEFTAIIGQSGSGKSTLLNAIGLLCNIDAGEIIYENRRIDNLFSWQKDKIRNHDFGLVFQFYHLLPEFTLLENILMPIMVRLSPFEWLINKRKYRLRAMELIHRVGLEHRVKHKPRELSGGEMQRAAIARALITSPRLLLADEPTGNLDQRTGREILELLYSLQREEKLTILMVTHDPIIAQEADRMYKLSEGKLL